MKQGLLDDNENVTRGPSRRVLLAGAAGLITLGVCIGVAGMYVAMSPSSQADTSTLLKAGAQSTTLFEDDFSTLDLSKWKHEISAGGGGNWEFEYYTNNRTNSYVKDGVLYIKPTLTEETFGTGSISDPTFNLDLWGSTPADTCTGNKFYGCFRTGMAGGNVVNPIQSARIRTAETFSFKYGRVEIRAKMPRGDWLWPAVWLLPKHNAYGTWPASGEVDIIESRGNTNYPHGVEEFGSTLHYGPFYPEDPWETAHGVYAVKSGDLADDFHTYGFVWNENEMYTYIDDDSNKVMSLDLSQKSFWELGGFDKIEGISNPWEGASKNAPFDQEFYIVMNLAVGGINSYWPDGVGNKPWSNTGSGQVNDFWAAKDQWYPTWKGEDAALRIDSIKVTSE